MASGCAKYQIIVWTKIGFWISCKFYTPGPTSTNDLSSEQASNDTHGVTQYQISLYILQVNFKQLFFIYKTKKYKTSETIVLLQVIVCYVEVESLVKGTVMGPPFILVCSCFRENNCVRQTVIFRNLFYAKAMFYGRDRPLFSHLMKFF